MIRELPAHTPEHTPEHDSWLSLLSLLADGSCSLHVSVVGDSDPAPRKAGDVNDPPTLVGTVLSDGPRRHCAADSLAGLVAGLAGVVVLKTCSACKIAKSLSSFSWSSRERGERYCYCKTCDRRRTKKYRGKGNKT